MLLSSAFIFLILLLCWFAGSFVFALCGNTGENKAADFFFRTLAGLCMVVILYAVIRSKMQTSLLVMLVPAFWLWKTKKQKRTGSLFSGIKFSLKWMGVALLLAVAISVILHYFLETTTIQEDSANYLKISEALRLTGAENTRHFRNVYSDMFHGMEPYHYFEMWLAALFMDVTGGAIPHLECLRTCSYGMILVLTVFGLMSVCEQAYNGFKPAHLVIAFVFLFFIPNIVQIFFNYERHFNFGIEANPLNRDNFRTYWLFLLPPLLLFQRKEFFSGSLLLLLLPAISFTTTPAVMGCLGLLIVLNRWTKFFSKQEALRLFLITAATGILLLGMLAIFKMKNVDSLYSFSSGAILGYFKSSWKAVASALFMEALNFLVVFGPAFLCLLFLMRANGGFKNVRSRFSFFLLFLVLINFSGIVLFQLTSFMNNTYQFAYIGYCAASLVFFVLFNEMVARVENAVWKRTAQAAFVVFMIFSCWKLSGLNRNSLFAGQHIYFQKYDRYDNAYLEDVNRIMGKGLEPGAFIGDSSYYAKMYYSKRLPDFYFPGLSYFIFANRDDSYQFCLSDTGAIYNGYSGNKRDFSFLRQAVGASLFHKTFFGESKVTIGEKRKMAIEKFHIGYIILTPGAKPDPEWEKLIKETVEDRKTGERFLVLQ